MNGTPNRCASVRDDLKAYADGELVFLRRLQVRRHLLSCADCRKELAIMETIGADLRAENPAVTLNENLRSRLLAATPDADVPAFMPAKRPIWKRQPLLAVGVAGTVVIGAVLFGQMYTQTLSDMNPPKSSPEAFSANVPPSEDKTGATNGMPARVPMLPPEATTVASANDSAGETTKSAPIVARVRMPSVYTPTADVAPPGASLNYERQVHRDVQLGITVAPDSLDQKAEQAETIVKAVGGYIASSNLSTGTEGYRTASIVVKVPQTAFDDTLRKFSALGRVTSKNLSTEDITETTSDATSAEAVLANQVKELDAKVRAAGTEKRELRREAELRQAQIQLAQTRARLGLLRKMAALSTLNLDISERPKEESKPADKSGFWSGMGETNRAATAAFQTALRVPLVMLMWILAFSPIWAPLLGWSRWMAYKKAKSQNITAER